VHSRALRWIGRHAAPAAALAILATAGCAGPARFIDPEADLAFYERVGVIPFTSLAQDRLAGEKTTNIFFTELLERRFAQVAEPGQFTAAMARTRGGTPITNPWSSAELAKLGEDAGVQGVFMGTVRDYDMAQVGRESFPLLSVEVRLVDTATGRVVWSASRTRQGGPSLPIIGFGEVHTMGELTSQVCRELLGSLPRD
jgi:TolB-like protein